MDATPASPSTSSARVAQWDDLRRTYRDLGHSVELIDPVPGLPDMVFAANGATVVDGMVYGARFRYPQRGAEAAAYRDWFRGRGLRAGGRARSTSTRARATCSSPAR